MSQSLIEAYRLHRNGQWPEAERAYRAHLEQKPQDPTALQLLGVLAFQGKRPDIALSLLGQAIAAAPLRAKPYWNTGVVLAANGRMDMAASYFLQATILDPGLAGIETTPSWRAGDDGEEIFELGITIDDTFLRSARLRLPAIA